MSKQQIHLSRSGGAKKQSGHGHHHPPHFAGQQPWRTISAIFIAIVLGLTLSGCDIGDTLWNLIHTDGDAEAETFANDAQRVRTFVITTASFIIETDNDDDPSPSATASDNATEYTMQSKGFVRFDESTGGTNRSFEVETGDRIIERPGASGTGTLTIVVASPSTQSQ